jgi:hypothetical protein
MPFDSTQIHLLVGVRERDWARSYYIHYSTEFRPLRCYTECTSYGTGEQTPFVQGCTFRQRRVFLAV